MPGTGVKDQILEHRMLLVSLGQEITRDLGVLCQERGAETSICISRYVTQPVLEVAAEQVPIFLAEVQSVVDPHRTLFAC